jgi:hypothetical protein
MENLGGPVTKFRPTTEKDAVLVADFLAADEEHSKTSTSSFWLPPQSEHKGVKYLTVEDSEGVIGFLVLENTLRIHAQFAPPDQVNRTRLALADVMTQIQHWARPQYKQIIFESVSLGLIWFLRKFGFRRSKNEIVCPL